MKIAVAFFGHLRTYKKCYKSVKKNLLSRYDCDVFMHTWDKLDHNTQTWHDFKVKGKIKDIEALTAELKQMYNLKTLKIETQRAGDEGELESRNRRISIYGMRCMFHSMHEAAGLVKEYQQQQHVSYDYIVMIRPDVMLCEKFDILPEIEDAAALYAASSFRSQPVINDFRFIGANDILFFARPEVISRALENVDAIVDAVKNKAWNQYSPEYAFQEYQKQNGRPTYLLNYFCGQDFEIIRGAKSKRKFRLMQIKIGRRQVKFVFLPRLRFFNTDLNLNIGRFNIRLGIGDK